MTSTPDLNISGSPIYENLVATSGDPYQPPSYQLPALFEPPDASGAGYGAQEAAGYGGAEYGVPADGHASPAMLSQFLSRMFGDGQSWVAVLVFGGPMAEQLRQSQQFLQQPFLQSPQFQQYAQPQMPQPFGPGAPGGYAEAADQAAMAQAYQAYQQMMMYQWAAQQQAMQQQQAMMPGQQPLALTAGPAAQAAEVPLPALPALPASPDPAGQAAAGFGTMLTEDWAGWLGQTSQSVRPQQAAQDEYEDYQEDRYEPSYERRGGRLSSRLGAAMRELRGR